jgi:hypothetical protein
MSPARREELLFKLKKADFYPSKNKKGGKNDKK